MRPLLITLAAASLLPAAQAAEAGRLPFLIGEGAQIELLPRVRPDVVLMAVHDNSVDIQSQLESHSARHVLGASAMSVGEGEWFIYVHLEKPGMTLEVEGTGVRRVLRVGPDQVPARAAPPPAPPLSMLIDGDLSPSPPGPPVLLTFLQADARTFGLAARDVRLDIASWAPSDMEGIPRALRRPAKHTGPEAIETFQRAVTEAPDQQAEAVARYRLAKALLDNRQAKDAAYELDRLTDLPVPWPTDTIHLLNGQAHIRSGNWDIAREECETAWRNDAASPAVLQCLGAVSLATSDPPPAATGRALAQVAHGEHRMLAAELLLRGHAPYEALAVLQSVETDSLADPDLHRAMLGDAHWLSGDYVAADEAWYRVAHTHPARAVLDERRRLFEILKLPPHEWVSELADLRHQGQKLSQDGRVEAQLAVAEIHWVEAQIQALVGDASEAVVHLDALIDGFAPFGSGQTVLTRLRNLCESELDKLDRRGMYTDEVVFFEACWRPELYQGEVDTDRLARLGDVFERLGMLERALDLSLDVVALRTRGDVSTDEANLVLARRYAALGRHADAAETLAFLRKRTRTPAADIDLMEAHTLAAAGDLDGAIAAAGRARKKQALREEADDQLALLRARAGACVAALPRLAQIDSDEARLHRARCLIEANRAAEAVDLAIVLADSPTPLVAEQAVWLAARAAHEADVDILGRIEITDPSWLSILAEDAEQRAFRARLADR